MGSILAMAAVVGVVAGLATVTTKQLHKVFGNKTPTDKSLQSLTDQFRSLLKAKKGELLKLKDQELDLLAYNAALDKKLFKAKHRNVGTIQTIYQEDVASFIFQDFPKAKYESSLLFVETATSTFVYKRKAGELYISVNGKPLGILKNNALYPSGVVSPLARIEEQQDGRTVHIDLEDKTLGIVYAGDQTNQVIPRACEFVDIEHTNERLYFEVLAIYHLVQQNIVS